jgi:D-beta-D-heptose 7-phosphate kinase/D-beta-D-heptose 1-phosphate adenosyltransferase
MTDTTHEHSLLTLSRAFPGKKVLVAGDVMLDEYVWGAVRRISPEAPVPVVEVERRTFAPGGAANTAANVVGLSGKVTLVGVVGRDPAADNLRNELQRLGVEAGGIVVDSNRPTTSKTRIIGHSQQVLRIDHEDQRPLTTSVEDILLQTVERYLRSADACILSDYAKGVVSQRFAQQFIRLAREAGKPIIVDPKGTNYSKYRDATIVKPNLLEAGQVLNRTINGMEDLQQAAGLLMEILGNSAVVITRGAQGLSLFRRGADPVHVPAEARDVYDVTGAGDTAASTLALTLACKGTFEQAARLANRAASVVVRKLGTAPVHLDELLALHG